MNSPSDSSLPRTRKRRRVDKAHKQEREVKIKREGAGDEKYDPGGDKKARTRDEALELFWKYWANHLEGRIVRVCMLSYDIHGHECRTFVSSEAIPAILLINRKSRAAGLSKYFRHFSCSWDLMDQRNSTTYFDPQKDTLYFGPEKERKYHKLSKLFLNSEAERIAQYDSTEIDFGTVLRRPNPHFGLDNGPWKSLAGQLQNLAIWLPPEDTEIEWTHFVRNISKAAPQLKSLFLVVWECLPRRLHLWPKEILWLPICRYHVSKDFDKRLENSLGEKIYRSQDREAIALRAKWHELHLANPLEVFQPPSIALKIYSSDECLERPNACPKCGNTFEYRSQRHGVDTPPESEWEGKRDGDGDGVKTEIKSEPED